MDNPTVTEPILDRWDVDATGAVPVAYSLEENPPVDEALCLSPLEDLCAPEEREPPAGQLPLPTNPEPQLCIDSKRTNHDVR